MKFTRSKKRTIKKEVFLYILHNNKSEQACVKVCVSEVKRQIPSVTVLLIFSCIVFLLAINVCHHHQTNNQQQFLSPSHIACSKHQKNIVKIRGLCLPQGQTRGKKNWLHVFNNLESVTVGLSFIVQSRSSRSTARTGTDGSLFFACIVLWFCAFVCRVFFFVVSVSKPFGWSKPKPNRNIETCDRNQTKLVSLDYYFCLNNYTVF